jgi:hypothetical protein
MFEIIVPKGHDTMNRVTLDGTVYVLRFTYNSTYDYWSIGIYDEQENEIIPMTKCVPYFDIFGMYPYDDLPKGVLFCDSKQGSVHESDFTNRIAHIVYMEEADLL